jgi:hypothetical protein
MSLNQALSNFRLPDPRDNAILSTTVENSYLRGLHPG